MRMNEIRNESEVTRKPGQVPEYHSRDAFSMFTELNELRVLYWMSYGMIAQALPILIALCCFIEAPYGRYASTSWGPTVNVRLAWFVQEMPSLVIPLYLWFIDSHQSSKLINKVLLSAFVFHYVHRTLIYPWLIRGGKPSPLSVVMMALGFTTYNGYLQTRYLLTYYEYPDYWLMSPYFITGSLLFISGILINVHSDHILRSLRSPGETGYKMPRGGMFEYISGANFFGEILEWTGFAVACWSLPTAAFAIFTACNIGGRALNHHKWYLKKFENYPKNRKALIPYIL